MLPLNHKRTTSSLAPPIFNVAKKLAKKIEGSPLLDCHVWKSSLGSVPIEGHDLGVDRWISAGKVGDALRPERLVGLVSQTSGLARHG